MKRSDMRKIFCFFGGAFYAAGMASAQQTAPWPEEFLNFYKEFRTTVIKEDYVGVTAMTCFPFKAIDNTETLGEVSYKKKLRLVNKKTFVKHDLGKYFLTRAGDIPDIRATDIKRITYLYKNYAHLIAENNDPRFLKKLEPNSSYYEPRSETAFIVGMEFTKKENRWCWSYVSYSRNENDKW